MTDTGPVYGREDIEKWYADDFQKWHHSNFIINADQNSPYITGTAGNERWSVGEWSETLQGKSGPIQLKGYWSAIDIREGDDWRIRMLTWNVTPPPAATPSPTTTPTDQ